MGQRGAIELIRFLSREELVKDIHIPLNEVRGGFRIKQTKTTDWDVIEKILLDFYYQSREAVLNISYSPKERRKYRDVSISAVKDILYSYSDKGNLISIFDIAGYDSPVVNNRGGIPALLDIIMMALIKEYTGMRFVNTITEYKEYEERYSIARELTRRFSNVNISDMKEPYLIAGGDFEKGSIEQHSFYTFICKVVACYDTLREETWV